MPGDSALLNIARLIFVDLHAFVEVSKFEGHISQELTITFLV